MPNLRVGDEAPDFEATTQRGRIRLRDHRGQWVVLYFYPKDGTVGCTKEACGFRDEFAALRKEGAVVIGVSRDDERSHEDFSRRHGLAFDLVADPSGQILKRYGALAWYGWAKRVTYLIDPNGRVANVYAWVRPTAHAKRVLADLRALKSKTNTTV